MQLGWIDFSKTERNKIMNVLDLLSEKGTLDELGISPIRDGFSNLFFPGTSTIQTRAKYFFAVPYALIQLEKSSETNPNRILKSLDVIERDCGEILLNQNTAESGIIGKRSLKSGRWVKRTPADIYWSGLKKYGIFTDSKLSLSEYVRISCQMKRKKSDYIKTGNRNDNAQENECDDKNAGDLYKKQFWKMPLYKEKWLDDFCITLTKEESAFLREQIISSCKGSMLGFILGNDIKEFVDCESFLDLGGIIEKFPGNMQEDYMLAAAFSDFIYAIRTVYNVIVSDEKNEWANYQLKQQREDFSLIADIDIDYIFEKLQIFNNPLLRKFLKQAQQCMFDDDIEGLKNRITSREAQLKGTGRAKTMHPGEFDPNEWYGGGQLDYRFYNAKTIVKDIMEGEGDYNA